MSAGGEFYRQATFVRVKITKLTGPYVRIERDGFYEHSQQEHREGNKEKSDHNSSRNSKLMQ